jgi:CheY-like chemotaxis protein
MIYPLKILLVEDNPLNQKIVAFYLKKENHHISIATTGEEAIKIFKPGYFNVVLMDLMLPGIDGFETTRQIREIENAHNDKEKSKIIALTANTLDNDRERCLLQGMDEYMAKPFDINKLNSILKIFNLGDFKPK